MPKFKKKPLTIDAIQWDGTKATWDKMQAMGDMQWMPGELGSDTFSLLTIDGNYALIRKGTWVCRGIAGEFYPCDPHIFEQTYEPADAS